MSAEALVKPLLALAVANVPADILALLVHGNPDLGVAPGALAKAIAVYLSNFRDDNTELVKRLRQKAQFASMASKMAANEKAARNRLAGDEDAVYLGLEPEDTDEWEAANALEAKAVLIAQAAQALEPFEEVDGEGAHDFPDDTKATVKFGPTTYYALTLGDFRRARAVRESCQ